VRCGMSCFSFLVCLLLMGLHIWRLSTVASTIGDLSNVIGLWLAMTVQRWRWRCGPACSRLAPCLAQLPTPHPPRNAGLAQLLSYIYPLSPTFRFKSVPAIFRPPTPENTPLCF
jgi:hypothetical protein